jgi:single-stranded DNA-specific DHH superfamily exonuclease
MSKVIEKLKKRLEVAKARKEEMIKEGLQTFFDDSKKMSNMIESANRFKQAMINNEKIYLISDSDADGIMSYRIMREFVEDVACYENVVFDITNRNEGYGLLVRHVERAKELGCSLIVTADHGISSIEATSRANELGIDVIITDHHQILKKEIDADLHEAIRNLNPITLTYTSPNLEKAEFIKAWINDELNYFNVSLKAKDMIETEDTTNPDSLNTVSFDLDEIDLLKPEVTKVLEVTPKTNFIVNCVLEDEFPNRMSGATVLALFFYNVEPYHWKKFLMEIYISTISDVIKVDRENPHNYKFVVLAQEMLKNDDDLFEFVENKQYLMTWFDNKTQGQVTLGVEDIGFGLAPLINSAKRKGDEQLVGDWIIETDEMKSQIQFEHLLATNEERKERQYSLTKKVFNLYAHSIDPDKQPFIALFLTKKVIESDKDKGMVGLVASRFTEEFNLPTMVLTYNSRTNSYSGSGRSPYGVIDVLMKSKYKEFLTHVGGHNSAFGIGVKGDKIDEFVKTLYSDEDLIKLRNDYRLHKVNAYEVEIDDLMSNNLRTIGELLDEIPFMYGFEAPKFALRNVQITSFRKFGGKSKDKFRGITINRQLNATMFNVPYKISTLQTRKNIDVDLITFNLNKFRDNYSLLVDKCYCSVD